jgi:hypothetical protein
MIMPRKVSSAMAFIDVVMIALLLFGLVMALRTGVIPKAPFFGEIDRATRPLRFWETIGGGLFGLLLFGGDLFYRLFSN